MSIKVTVYEEIDKYNNRTKSFKSHKNHGSRVLRNDYYVKDNYDGRLIHIGEVNIKGENVRVAVGDPLGNGTRYSHIIPKNAWDLVYSRYEKVAA